MAGFCEDILNYMNLIFILYALLYYMILKLFYITLFIEGTFSALSSLYYDLLLFGFKSLTQSSSDSSS